MGSILGSRVLDPAETAVKACFGTDSLVPSWDSSTVCIGVFDGVHVGHQEVVRMAVRDAREQGRPAIVLTFDRHPARTLRPDLAPPMVATLGQNLRALAHCGADLVLVLPFDRALADTTAEQFTEVTIKGLLRAGRLVVGHDFAFGRGREGTPEWLATRLPTTVVGPFGPDGHRASSSEIRNAVASGRVEDAARWLGRPYGLVGVVVRGEQWGRRLGYPTANLLPIARQVVPSEGVYVGECEAAGGRYRAAASIGTRPTVGGSSLVIEAHLLDFPGDSLYGTFVELAFFVKLRDQVKFEDTDALCAQMGRDVDQVKNFEAAEFARLGQERS